MPPWSCGGCFSRAIVSIPTAPYPHFSNHTLTLWNKSDGAGAFARKAAASEPASSSQECPFSGLAKKG